MKISYDGLFHILEERQMGKTELQRQTGISSATLAKLSKNEYVSLKVIEDICKVLNCQPGEILSLERETDPQSLIYRLREEKQMGQKGGIYHQTQIKLAYNSNHMEGSTLTENQTRCIYETNTIGLEKEAVNVDDVIETVNHFQCFDYIIDCAEDTLTEYIIKKLHALLKAGTSVSRLDWFAVGEYKRHPNMMGDARTTPPAKVKYEMQRFLFEYGQKETVSFEDLMEFHCRFENIHPFQDGNGQVGRLILFKECLRYGIVPFIINERHKRDYYRGLQEFDQERGYLTDTCLSAQDRYQEMLDYFRGQ